MAGTRPPFTTASAGQAVGDAIVHQHAVPSRGKAATARCMASK